MESGVSWKDDILGTPFECTSIKLPDDDEGPVVATLVRRKCPTNTGKAALYVHGFCDYFFQREMADQIVAHGMDFYAIDLRKYGRSILPHQTPNFISKIDEYFEEIELAMQIIRKDDHHDKVLLSAHSTGGLITAHFVNNAQPDLRPDAIFLNSPFFEFNDDWLTRELLLDVIGAVGGRHPYATMPGGLSALYAESLHKDHKGVWDFNTKWKPMAGFPITAGWIRAIHNGHKSLHEGLDIRVPILVMHSGESTRAKEWSENLLSTDAVLNVNDIRRYADCLGDHVTKIRIHGGMHDLILSKKEVRDTVYKELFVWLQAYFQ